MQRTTPSIRHIIRCGAEHQDHACIHGAGRSSCSHLLVRRFSFVRVLACAIMCLCDTSLVHACVYLSQIAQPVLDWAQDFLASQLHPQAIAAPQILRVLDTLDTALAAEIQVGCKGWEIIGVRGGDTAGTV